MIDIDTEASDVKRPCANLVPIVEFLRRSGNRFASPASEDGDHGFYLTQGGWQCDLAEPIDFSAIKRRFNLPATIDASPDFDSILDRMSWCAIEGPGASEAQVRIDTST